MTRLNALNEFKIVKFDEKMILEDNVEDWPLVDALIAFHSEGYPLDKVRDYCDLRKPFLINDVDK
eukprot:CAMPEP_0114575522 /NCGR_PEP_ID=MMETSP0125-20121206/380_1 /TAXON_ID=485358 ORGANISM="Aristerostoma sp., Strain ATCC 50986" /NCGR_SAMPLE_ID=MMETSP0125 /ASSEMBLY_ACC=CAM_ASM_000245 /LENGTH=64 /DNA_ID=CAMNT_0001763313 /DNA_START=132 /DNA_END=326 /DNA_ORIENTATION=-